MITIIAHIIHISNVYLTKKTKCSRGGKRRTDDLLDAMKKDSDAMERRGKK